MGAGKWYLPNYGLTPYLGSTQTMVLQRIRQILGQTHVHRSLDPYCSIVNPLKMLVSFTPILYDAPPFRSHR